MNTTFIFITQLLIVHVYGFIHKLNLLGLLRYELAVVPELLVQVTQFHICLELP